MGLVLASHERKNGAKPEESSEIVKGRRKLRTPVIKSNLRSFKTEVCQLWGGLNRNTRER